MMCCALLSPKQKKKEPREKRVNSVTHFSILFLHHTRNGVMCRAIHNPYYPCWRTNLMSFEMIWFIVWKTNLQKLWTHTTDSHYKWRGGKTKLKGKIIRQYYSHTYKYGRPLYDFAIFILHSVGCIRHWYRLKNLDDLLKTKFKIFFKILCYDPRVYLQLQAISWTI